MKLNVVYKRVGELVPYENNPRNNDGAVVTSWKLGSSLSLGMFIFTRTPYDLKLVQHEYGHTVQRLILEPLWLFVIGLPSLV